MADRLPPHLLEDSRERHRAFRAERDLELRRRRALLSLGERLDAALRKARTLSGASASAQERTNRGKPGSAPPPPIAGALYASEELHGFYSRRLGLLIEALEREVDAHLVRPLTADSDETGEEIERRLIQDFEGIPSTEVPFLDPIWAKRAPRNPVRAVERARVKHGRIGNSGRKLEDVQKVRAGKAA